MTVNGSVETVSPRAKLAGPLILLFQRDRPRGDVREQQLELPLVGHLRHAVLGGQPVDQRHRWEGEASLADQVVA